MNTFGRIFRMSVFGESHGESVGVLLDGIPPGIPLDESIFTAALERRKPGAAGTTNRVEDDKPVIISGVFRGHSTGAPLMIVFGNKDRQAGDYDSLKSKPRPGHADFTAYKKYNGYNDYRGGGHFSGRLTAGMVAAGTVAQKILGDTLIEAELIEAGGSMDISAAVQKAVDSGDSAGGIIECRIKGLPAGLGEPFFDSVESCVSHIIFSIPGIKGIEFGRGFESASIPGSEMNDEIIDTDGKTATNNAGGINGGITNSNEVVFRVAVKPTSSIPRKQFTVDLDTGEKEEIVVKGRHDACFALRVPVIVESAAAIALADLMLINNALKRI